MTLAYDEPRPAHKIISGDIVELHAYITTQKFFRKITQKQIVGYGVIVDFTYDSGYTATVNVLGKNVNHSPEDLKLVQRVENRGAELVDELEEYLNKLQ